MDNKIIFIVICIIILLFYVIPKNNTHKKSVENFNIISNAINTLQNPGNWIGNNVRGVWGGVRDPLIFVRNYAYNILPNYTWITRYYDKKNDWIRANKGLPPLLPTSASNAKMTFNINTDTKNKEYSLKPVGYMQSVSNLVA